MLRLLRHYCSVYAGFFSTCFAKEAGFRAHFFLLIAVDVLFYISTIASVHIIYRHTAMIGVWDERQLQFFVAFMLVVDQLHMGLVSESFWTLSPLVRLGGLDFVLVKPISSLFQVFFRYIRPATLLLYIPGWLHLFYRASELGFDWTQLLLTPPVLLLSAFLLFGIEICFSTAIFWLQYGQGVNFIRLGLQRMARWPDFVYRGMVRKVFTFAIPVLMIGSQSSYFLFDPVSVKPLLWLLAATAGAWFFAVRLWKLGLRKNESASS